MTVPAIRGVYEVVVRVRDLERAEAFYRDVLGLELGLADPRRPMSFWRVAGCDGMLVSGDAAAFCLGAGLWLEGVNFAIGGGALAAEAAVAALDSGSPGPSMVDDYRRRLEGSFVLADHKKLRRAPGLLMSDRVQFRYPQLVCDLVQDVFEVTNPDPKPGISKLFERARRASGVKRRQLLRDAWTGYRSYG